MVWLDLLYFYGSLSRTGTKIQQQQNIGPSMQHHCFDHAWISHPGSSLVPAKERHLLLCFLSSFSDYYRLQQTIESLSFPLLHRADMYTLFSNLPFASNSSWRNSNEYDFLIQSHPTPDDVSEIPRCGIPRAILSYTASTRPNLFPL